MAGGDSPAAIASGGGGGGAGLSAAGSDHAFRMDEGRRSYVNFLSCSNRGDLSAALSASASVGFAAELRPILDGMGVVRVLTRPFSKTILAAAGCPHAEAANPQLQTPTNSTAIDRQRVEILMGIVTPPRLAVWPISLAVAPTLLAVSHGHRLRFRTPLSGR
jgi:hypothetical protein